MITSLAAQPGRVNQTAITGGSALARHEGQAARCHRSVAPGGAGSGWYPPDLARYVCPRSDQAKRSTGTTRDSRYTMASHNWVAQ